jgi:hypothetical protein
MEDWKTITITITITSRRQNASIVRSYFLLAGGIPSSLLHSRIDPSSPARCDIRQWRSQFPTKFPVLSPVPLGIPTMTPCPRIAPYCCRKVRPASSLLSTSLMINTYCFLNQSLEDQE